ncbi:MAG: DUF4419 domain-containing protein [Cyanobacteria bacterium]|nr:DUF4419 domain-containing protein [Cyanobacteriota bacterium]
MITRTQENGITFLVDAVEPASELLTESKLGDDLRCRLSQADGSPPIKLLSWSGYNSNCVASVSFHPLLGAVDLAFSQHRPLVLSPDMIWVTILQGLAQHVRINQDSLRHKLVQHDGKLAIEVQRDDIFIASPETAWNEVVHDLSKVLRGHIGLRYDELINNFSTTGDVERTVCEIAILDTFEPYFDYNLYCVCGIPSITLEGTTDDWHALRRKVEALSEYDLDWWLVHLRSILDQFQRASNGHISLDHWQNIYKQRTAYGWAQINGWISKLFPYLKDYESNLFTRRNPLLFKQMPAGWEDEEVLFGEPDDPTARDFPSGASLVPFKLHANKTQTVMQFIGGFIGVEQDHETLALRPKLGWAVRKAPESDWLPDTLPDGIVVLPPVEVSDYNRRVAKFEKGKRGVSLLPNYLANFYRQCNGIVCRTGRAEARIRSINDLAYEPNLKRQDSTPNAPETFHNDPLVVADLPDGSRVLLYFSYRSESLHKVFANGRSLKLAAKTFAEFVRQFIDTRGQI